MRKIAFLIGGVEISGGINVIFQHAIYLAQQGYEISFISIKPVYPSDIHWHPLYNFIKEHDHCNITWYTFNDLDDVCFDVAIATWWRTFFNLWKVKATYYTYFVQSIESRFYPQNEVALRSVVESTYELDMGYITECNWISQYLLDNYNHKVPIARNGIDKQIFREVKAFRDRSENKLRVLVEGPVDVHFKNIPSTISVVGRSLADELWLLTPSDINHIQGVDKVYSKIPICYTPAVYSSCDVIVKLSYVEGMFGPPLEMFHCGGTCIVYNVTGYDEYIKHQENGIVVDTDAEDEVIQCINELKGNEELLQRLKNGALATAATWPDWPTSSQIFEKAIYKAVEETAVSHQLLRTFAKRIWHIYEYKHT